MQWHYVRDGQAAGPERPEVLLAMLQRGELDAETYVWREGLPDWIPYYTAAAQGELPPVPPPIPPLPPPAWAPPPDAARDAASTPHAPAWEFASVGRRFGALMMDGLLLSVILQFYVSARIPGYADLPLLEQMEAVSNFLFITQFMYSTVLVGAFGGTVGKLLLGMRIIRPDGGRVGFPRALGRFLAQQFLSGLLTFGIGYVIALFDAERRTLHDRVCGTRVIRLRQ